MRPNKALLECWVAPNTRRSALASGASPQQSPHPPQPPAAVPLELSHLSTLALVWFVVALLAAGFAHGLIGFGFPLIATPLVVLILDFKTAVAALILPTLVVSTINTFRGGNAVRNLGRFWFMPLAPIVGSYAGTRLLLVSPAEPFMLLLAALLLFFLFRDRLGRVEIPAVERHPVIAGVIAGLAAGVFESTANVAMAPFLIYFLALGVAPTTMVQAMNLCFVAGKTMQLIGWLEAGVHPASFWFTTLALGAIGLAALFLGERIRRGVDTSTYMRWLRMFLWTMTALLIVQVLWRAIRTV